MRRLLEYYQVYYQVILKIFQTKTKIYLEKEVQLTYQRFLGLHISFIIITISFLLEKGILGKRVNYGITIVMLVCFIFIIGFSPSAVRAVIMGITFLASKILYRKYDIITAIVFSLIVILIINLYSIFDTGLLLSYSSTIRNFNIL